MRPRATAARERGKIGRPATNRQDAAPAVTPARTAAELLLLVLIWAVNFSVIKVALEELQPTAFNALRFVLASGVVMGVLRAQGRLRLPERRDWPRLLLLGVLGNVVYQLLFIHGIDRTRAGNASLLLAATPISTAVLSALLGHERIRPAVWVGVVATVAGMALVVVAGHAGVGLGRETLAGDLLMITASLAWSVYTVGAREPIGRYGPVAVTAWTMWIGTAGLVLVGLPALADTAWGEVSAAGWLGVGYSGALGIGIAYLLWYHGVRTIGNTRTATYSNLVPVAALLVAWLWLGEVPTAGQIAGAAVIIGGVTLANVTRRRARPAAAAAEPPGGGAVS